MGRKNKLATIFFVENYSYYNCIKGRYFDPQVPTQSGLGIQAYETFRVGKFHLVFLNQKAPL